MGEQKEGEVGDCSRKATTLKPAEELIESRGSEDQVMEVIESRGSQGIIESQVKTALPSLPTSALNKAIRILQKHGKVKLVRTKDDTYHLMSVDFTPPLSLIGGCRSHIDEADYKTFLDDAKMVIFLADNNLV